MTIHKKSFFRSFFALASVATVFTACDKSPYPGFDKTESGLYYDFHTEGKGTKPKEGDVMSISMVYKTMKDSLIFDSKNREGGTILVPLQKPAFKGALEEGFAMMSEGDSATFLVNGDSLFMKTFGLQEAPKFINRGDLIKFHVKLVKVQTNEAYKEERMKEMKVKEEAEAGEAKAYLEKNKITSAPTASGLIYVEEKKGTGKKAEAGKMVSVHYTGTLLDGTKFDSSVDRGEPIEFMLGTGQVIPGWDEGIAMMNESGKATLVIPSKLAYGAGGQGPIPPFSTLAFTVELIKVKDAPAPPANAQAPAAK